MTASHAKLVLEELQNGLLTVVLNRPERRNALNSELCGQLVDALQRAAESAEVRAVLLKGAGGTFCVGDFPTIANSFSTGKIDDSRLYGSVGLRFGW